MEFCLQILAWQLAFWAQVWQLALPAQAPALVPVSPVKPVPVWFPRIPASSVSA